MNEPFPTRFFQSCWEKHPFNKTDTREHFASKTREAKRYEMDVESVRNLRWDNVVAM